MNASGKLLDPLADWPYLTAVPAALEAGQFSPVIFRQVLDRGTELLKDRFIADEPVEDLVRDRARLVDMALRAAWANHAAKFAGDLGLIAVGGYGRGELHPSSDIDIMVLLPKSDSADWQPDIERFLTFLWDIGLEVGRDRKEHLVEHAGLVANTHERDRQGIEEPRGFEGLHQRLTRPHRDLDRAQGLGIDRAPGDWPYDVERRHEVDPRSQQCSEHPRDARSNRLAHDRAEQWQPQAKAIETERSALGSDDERCSGEGGGQNSGDCEPSVWLRERRTGTE